MNTVCASTSRSKDINLDFFVTFSKLHIIRVATAQGKQGISGWPRHRENREFGSYFFQTGKTQGILL